MTTFHPDAHRSFAERAQTLLDLVPANAPPTAGPDLPSGFAPDVPIAGRITDADLAGIARRRLYDADGTQVGLQVALPDGYVSFEGSQYLELRALTESIHNTPAMRDCVSFGTLHDWVADWMLESHLAKRADPLPDYLLERRAEAVGLYRVMVPLHEPFIEVPFAIGKVTFAPLDRKSLESWFTIPESIKVKDRTEVEQHLASRRKRLQGRTAAINEVEAERQLAEETAYDKADLAASMLRLFSKGMFFPRVRSGCVPMGRAVIEKRYVLVIRDGEFLGASDAFADMQSTASWMLDRRMIAQDLPYLTRLGALLDAKSPTDFERDVLRAVLLYSRAALSREVSEKLVYLFAAAESLLLRSESEPVQSAVSERIAFVIGRDAADRAQTASLVKTVYGLRSRFVHHGRDADKPTDLTAVKQLLFSIWHFFYHVVWSTKQFASKNDFLDALERRKWQ